MAAPKTRALNVLGVNIHNLGKNELRPALDRFLAGDRPALITTVNPEFLVEARKNEEFFYILNSSDLALADGIGLVFAGACLGRLVRRVTGVCLARELIGHPALKRLLVFNYRHGLQSAEELSASLARLRPGLERLVVDIGRREGERPDWERIRAFAPQAVLSTLGSPWQERFLFRQQKELPSARILSGVGGALDYLGGRVKRAPKPWRRLGLEWLFRLLANPRRARRIGRATVVFPLLFLRWRLLEPLLYRPNVACLLYRHSGQGKQILMVERQDQPGHWQLPQGGLDGLGVKEAGLKELAEECGLAKARYVRHTGFIHRYRFPKGETRGRGARYAPGTGYKGQKQALLIAEYAGQGNDIRVNDWDHRAWKWVDIKDAPSLAHPLRQESLKLYLEILSNV